MVKLQFILGLPISYQPCPTPSSKIGFINTIKQKASEPTQYKYSCSLNATMHGFIKFKLFLISIHQCFSANYRGEHLLPVWWEFFFSFHFYFLNFLIDLPKASLSFSAERGWVKQMFLIQTQNTAPPLHFVSACNVKQLWIIITTLDFCLLQLYVMSHRG